MITVWTGNQPRHLAMISAVCMRYGYDNVLAVMECTTTRPGMMQDFYDKTETMQKYWQRVMFAESTVFNPCELCCCPCLPLRLGDLSLLTVDDLRMLLFSDRHVVFGASYIKGDLCDKLIEKSAINIHMGVAPQYRGSGCNFWAEYDNNPEFVGATLHLLTKGLDSGPIIKSIVAPYEPDPFVRGMLAVREAISAVVDVLHVGLPKKLEAQDKAKEIRYSRYSDFTDDVVEDYLSRFEEA